MKTSIFICTIAFSAACLLAGCEKENTEISDGGIRFTANGSNTFSVCEVPTKVSLYNNITDFTNSGASFAVLANDQDYSATVFGEKIVTKSGDYYEPAEAYYWYGDYINVYAVAPYISGSRPSTISNLKVITDPTGKDSADYKNYLSFDKDYLSFDYQTLNSGIRVDASSLNDIMVGFNQNSHECSGSSKIVNINFYHVLSGMRFKAGNTLIGKTIKSISLIDFEAVGKFYVNISDSKVEEIKFKGLLLGGKTATDTNRYIYDNKYGVHGVTIASDDVGNEIGGAGNIIFLPPASLNTDNAPYFSRLRVIIEEDGKDLVYSKLFPTIESQEKLKPSYIYDITIDIDDYKYTRTSTTDNPLRLSVTKTPME